MPTQDDLEERWLQLLTDVQSELGDGLTPG
jgi:hypothetical protein